MNNYQWYSPRNTRGAWQGVHSVDTVTSLSAQVDALTTRLNQLSKGKTAAEVTEEVKSITTNTEQVDFIGTNRLQNNPYSNTNHPNFSRKDNNKQGQSGFGQQQQQFQQRPPQNYQPRQQFQGTNKPSNVLSLEDAVTKLISTTESQALLADSLHKQYEEKFSLHEAEFRTQKATLRSIETQLGQIAKLLSERQPRCLPSNTETNPKGNVSAITLRNSKVYPEPPMPEEEVQSTRRKIFTGVPLRPHIIETTTQEPQSKTTPPPAQVYTPPKVPTKRTFHSHIPYPGRLVKQKTDEQYEKFIELLSQIHVNLSFLDIIQQIPKYGRFLKDFLTNKRNMEEVVKRTNHCVALIERCLPKKLSDPGKFSLPLTYNIGGNECLSNDPFEIAQFIDTNMDYQLKKAKEFNKGKKLNLGKDFENTDLIDEYFDKLPKLKDLNEGTGDTVEVDGSHPKKD
ncbi:hypothetical protein L1987_00896 [Smallanthus sonchifolius]|uniref:Uncharacterized protein n=1 Tax=Smallanthus sonchifolius TaxID=185202 RepID=A0ACB9K3L8_9ASTR|nr:hypothetical protein L1987_00896 [Smallanthus sonchifolius]